MSSQHSTRRINHLPRKSPRQKWGQLRDYEVIDIRQRKAAGETSLSIAASYGVNRGVITKITMGKTYTHLPNIEPKRPVPPSGLKEIPGFAGYYVTPQGDVWSRNGKLSRGCFLEPMFIVLRSGYPSVTLKLNGRRCHISVHTLLLMTFVGPCPPGMECRHLNGKPLDCRVDNLAWGTRREQFDDMRRHQTLSQGSKRYSAKLTEKAVAEIRLQRSAGRKLKDIADDYGVCMPLISGIVNRKRWKHVD